MKLLRILGLAFAFLVPVAAIASPAVRAAVPCCPGACCHSGGCPFCNH